VKAPGPAAIPEVLPPQAAEIERVCVIHHSFASVGQSVSVFDPPIAKFAIFRRSEGRIETAHGPESAGCYRHIVRGKEPSLAHTGIIIMSVRKVDNCLTCHRVLIVFKCVQSASAKNMVW